MASATEETAPNGSERRAVLEQLLVRHLDRLRAFVWLRLGSFLRGRESDSDVVQSVCREALEHADRFEFRGEREFENWLYGAVLRKVRDHERFYRAHRRGAAHAIADREVEQLIDAYRSACSPSRIAIGVEDMRRVEAAFSRLPQHYAEALILSRVVGLQREAAAKVLGVSLDAFAMHLRRATVRLAHLLDDAPAEHGDSGDQ